MVFEVTLNFSKKKKVTHTGPDLKKSDLPQVLSAVLTRRIVLGQVMTTWDPLGFASPKLCLELCICKKPDLKSSIGIISSMLSKSTSSVPDPAGAARIVQMIAATQLSWLTMAYYPQWWQRSTLWFCSILQMAT